MIDHYLDFLNFTHHQLPIPSEKQAFVRMVWEQAFSREERIFTNTRVEAIRALAVLVPEDAFLACRDALQSLRREAERLQIPRLMLTLDRDTALYEFQTILLEEEDSRLVLAIGEALAREEDFGLTVLLSWLEDRNALIREAAASAAQAFAWSERLDQQLRILLDDYHWEVRDQAEASLLQILNHREILRLRELMNEQTTLARKWAAMDVGLRLGHPGVSGVWPVWYAPLVEGMPYLAKKFAAEKVKKRGEKLSKDLEGKPRSHTRLIIQKMETNPETKPS